MSGDRTPRRKRRRWLTGCLVILVTLLLMVTVAWVFLGLLSGRSDEALKAKGYPTTLAELDEWYVDPPAGENAADFFLQAGQLVERSTFPDLANLPIQGDAELPPIGTPMPESMQRIITLFIAHEAEAFELIDEGVEFDGARYPIQFAITPGTNPFPHLSTVRNTVRGQTLRTLLANTQGDSEVLLAEFDKLTRVASSLQEEPILLSSLVSIATTSMAVSTAHRILNENEFNREQFAQFDRSLVRLLDNDGLMRAFIGERCYASHLISAQMRVPIVSDIYRADHLGAIDKFIELAEGGLPNRLDLYREGQDVTRSYVRPLSSLITPALVSNTHAFYETRATVLAARVAIAIEIWRLDGGELPEDRNEFPESIRENWPIDPFSGNPLIYKRLEEGYVVYSIGGDLEDDGGIYKDAETTALRGRDEDARFTILK